MALPASTRLNSYPLGKPAPCASLHSGWRAFVFSYVLHTIYMYIYAPECIWATTAATAQYSIASAGLPLSYALRLRQLSGHCWPEATHPMASTVRLAFYLLCRRCQIERQRLPAQVSGSEAVGLPVLYCLYRD